MAAEHSAFVRQAEQVLIAQYRSRGRDPLRTFEADWRARVVDSVSYEGAPVAEAGSVFDAPVDFTTVEYPLAVQPIRADKVERWLAPGRVAYDRDATRESFLKHRASRLHLTTLPYGRFAGVESVEAGLQAEGTNPVKRTHQTLAQIGDFLEQVAVGSMIARDEPRGEEEPPDRLIGRVVAIHPPPEKAAYLPGRYLVRIAVPGHERLAAKSLYALNQAGYTTQDRAEVAAVLGDRFAWIARPHYRDGYNDYQESLAAGVAEAAPASNRQAAAWRA